MADETTQAQARAVELRTERGDLQGKIYAGRYLEIVDRGVVRVYDVRTGARIEAALRNIHQAATGEGR